MIYVQLRARVKLAQGETLHVADAAKVLGSEKAGHCSLFCPTSPGVYTLDAIAVAKALKKVFPQEDISLIGFDGLPICRYGLPRRIAKGHVRAHPCTRNEPWLRIF